jgi:N-acetylmuramoyl-L-alanine amidase
MTERVVLDAGHGGGMSANGLSTPDGARGPGGSLEKDLTLVMARMAAAELGRRGVGVRLTRTGDDNPSVRQRIAVASGAGAEAFLSLHFNYSADPSARGAELWVHDAAGPRSRALAQAVSAALGAGGAVRVGEMAVLDPAWHAPGTAACLAEIAYLSNPDEERRLNDPAERARLAAALAGGIATFLGAAEPAAVVVERSQSSFDIWHEVPMVPQLTGMSCWAAAAAMIVGWRDCIDVRPEEVALGAGAWEEYRDGLEPSNVDALARTFGLVIETPRIYSVEGVRALLERFGPLWVGAGPTGLHVIVVSGMYGDGSPDGTFVRVLDPWPLGRGERYTLSFSDMAANLETASDVAGVRASILHCGEVARGGSGRRVSFHQEYEAHATLGSGGDGRRAPARYGTPLALFNVYKNDPPPPWRDHATAAAASAFSLSGTELARLAAVNRLDPGAAPRLVLFGVRGCRLAGGASEGTWADTLSLEADTAGGRPSSCVLGLWRPADGRVAAFEGSTLPEGARPLPTGLHRCRLREAPFSLGSDGANRRFRSIAHAAGAASGALPYLLLSGREARLAAGPTI